MRTLVRLELSVTRRMLRSLSLLLFLFSFPLLAKTPLISIELLDPKNRGDFLSHEEWLGISFPIGEIVKIKKQLEDITGEKLFALSDSYLIVVTTQEWSILKTALKMSDIDKLFLQHKLNFLKLQPHCLARLEGKVGEVSYSQWALVLKDSQLLEDFRRDLRRLFRARGGLGDDYQVSRWKPLLVVGFSSREYFDQDSLIKSNQAKCIYKF